MMGVLAALALADGPWRPKPVRRPATLERQDMGQLPPCAGSTWIGSRAGRPRRRCAI